MVNSLSPAQEKLLLATRCFGRGTPFPHRLMQNVLAEVDDTSYQQVIADLFKRKLIRKEGRLAFSLTSEGLRVRGSDVVPAPIWDAVIAVMKLTIAQTIDADERSSIDLLTIHAAALANVFSSKIPYLYIELLGLCIICLEHLGRVDDAEIYKRKLQAALDDWHSKQKDED